MGRIFKNNIYWWVAAMKENGEKYRELKIKSLQHNLQVIWQNKSFLLKMTHLLSSGMSWGP